MTTYLQTLEIRWFGDRSLGDDEREWFESIGGSRHRRGEERTDRYVKLPGVTDLGLKFRGDQGFDFKARLDEIGIAELRREGELFASGIVETWAKWSYAGPEYPALGTAFGRLETIEVAKQRWQYLFDLASETPTEPLDLSEGPYPRVERGMALEIGDVSCQGRTVWTLGVEAIPGSPDLGSDMLAALRRLLQDCPLEMAAESSSGYPAWLAGSGPTRSA